MEWMKAYQQSWQSGRAAVLAGEHLIERPLGDGPRWGMSYILRLGPPAATRLAELSQHLSEVIGLHCDPHDASTLHTNVRALEPYRPDIVDDDPLVRSYVDVLHEVAPSSRPIHLTFPGLTLATRGVLACGIPTDDAAMNLWDNLGNALVQRGIAPLPSERVKNMWHVTLVHYTGAIANPARLVDWVGARRSLDLGTAELPTLDLVRYTTDGHGIRIVPLATTRLGRSTDT